MLIDSARLIDHALSARRSSADAGRKARVLIIGGGFSGTMTAVQLARRDMPSIIIDPNERPARGTAYSTPSENHCLNVRAGNMSALPHRPDDFASYIASRTGRTNEFESRRDYGDYLEQTLAPYVSDGLVRFVRGRAVAARPATNGWHVDLEDGETLAATTLVLAIGNAPPPPLAGIGSVDKADLIDLFWNPGSLPRLKIAAANDEPVLIVGTGLTMIDALLSLDAAGHRGPVTALSRHGLLPLPHGDVGPPALPAPTLEEVPTSLSDLLHWLRGRARAEKDWRLAIDGLRPRTQSIWKKMGRATRERFLRHGRPYWDVHRHRVPPAIHARVMEFKNEGRLQIFAGKLIGSERRSGRYRVRVEPRRGGDPIELDVGLVINCTGPLSRLRDNLDPLVVQMLSDELMRPDELELGAEIDAQDRLAGLANAYAIGPLARGRYWEITAVPDLRTKADEIASAIVALDPEPASNEADQSSGV
jgi:uncharacterized NAD(P)/FAD-binding protein YdhS